MRRYFTLLLFLGLAYGQSLKFVNTDGQSITFKKAKSSFNPHSTFYLNGTKYFLKNIDFKTKVVKVKKVYRTSISQLINYNKYEEIPFDSIRSFRYLKRSFSIIPMLIGGGLGVHFFSKGDTPSFYFGTMPAFTFGVLLSFIPQFSEELFLNDDGWSIVND